MKDKECPFCNEKGFIRHYVYKGGIKWWCDRCKNHIPNRYTSDYKIYIDNEKDFYWERIVCPHFIAAKNCKLKNLNTPCPIKSPVGDYLVDYWGCETLTTEESRLIKNLEITK